MSEDWTLNNAYCPNCGSIIEKFPNNHYCGDFYCANCYEEFELKTKKDNFGSLIVDGAYKVLYDKLRRKKFPISFC